MSKQNNKEINEKLEIMEEIRLQIDILFGLYGFEEGTLVEKLSKLNRLKKHLDTEFSTNEDMIKFWSVYSSDNYVCGILADVQRIEYSDRIPFLKEDITAEYKNILPEILNINYENVDINIIMKNIREIGALNGVSETFNKLLGSLFESENIKDYKYQQIFNLIDIEEFEEYLKNLA